MKKAIIILLIFMLGGCTTIERLMLPDAKKPERNVLSQQASGVTFTEIDFMTQFPNLADFNKAQLSAFSEVGNLLYFAYSENSNSEHAGVPIAKGIYTYDFETKAFKKILTFDPKKEFYISSIAILKGKVYFSGGYPFGPKGNECDYEISVLNGTKVKVLLHETANNYRDIPKLLKFDSSSLAFLQIHHQRLSDVEVKSSFKITRIRTDSSLRSSTEYKGTIKGDFMSVGSPMMETVSIDGTKFAYVVYKNGVSSIYGAAFNTQTGQFEDSLPIKIGEEISPQNMIGFGNHWYVSSFRNVHMRTLLDVFDQTTGKRVADQIFEEGTHAFMLAALDSSTGISYGNFEQGNGSGPIGIGRLFLTYVEGNTVKYQRIEKIRFTSWPISFTKLSDKKYLVRGILDLNNPVWTHIVLEIN